MKKGEEKVDTAKGSNTRTGPLTGVRVLDFTHMVAGSYMTLQMAYLGADIIKVESETRIDGWRVRDGNADYEMSWPFCDHNKGKRGITLNLKHPEAVHLVQRLVSHCDAVTENFSAGVMTRLGLGDDALRMANPDLIIIHLPAMGTIGPRRDWVAWGPDLLAYTGFTHLWNHRTTDVPVGTQTSYLDYVVGLHGAVALVSAILHRDFTGEGMVVELAQADTAVSFLGPLVLEALINGMDPMPSGNQSPWAVPSGCFPCSGEDVWSVLLVRDDFEWAALVEVMEHPSWVRPEHASLMGRMIDHVNIEERLRAFTRTQNREYLISRLQVAGVPAAPVNNAKDLACDMGLERGGYFDEINHPRIGQHMFPGPAMQFSETPENHGQRAPLLGEHTVHVLEELLQADQPQIQAWRASGLLR